MLVFVGTYTEPVVSGVQENVPGKGEGIYTYRFDKASGVLEFVSKTVEIANPSYLEFDPKSKFLYAANELQHCENQKSGTVSAFAVNQNNGKLTFLNKRFTHGTDPCYVRVDKQGKYVLVTNYTSGSVCVLPILPDGSLGEASDYIQHVGSGFDPSRQDGPHTHSVTFDKSNSFAFVADLGLDRVMVYRFDRNRGILESNEASGVKMKPGSGPRHMAFHPNGRYSYLINELNGTVAVLAYSAQRGRFKLVQIVPTLPSDFHGENWCADIHVAPSGKFVYGSNRGHDSIVIYKADPRTGRLAYVDHEPTRGKTPRGFTIDPSGEFLLVANQDSDSVISFRIDSRTGKLQFVGSVTGVPNPVCIKLLSAKGA